MCSMRMGDVDAHVGVYYVANATYDRFDIADVAIRLLRGESYPVADRQAVPVDPKVLDRYVGIYVAEDSVSPSVAKATDFSCRRTKSRKRESFWQRRRPSSVNKQNRQKCAEKYGGGGGS